MRLTGNFKKIPKKNSEIFSQFLVFWELLLSPVVEKVVFVFVSLRYGADLGRSRLVIHEYKKRRLQEYKKVAVATWRRSSCRPSAASPTAVWCAAALESPRGRPLSCTYPGSCSPLGCPRLPSPPAERWPWSCLSWRVRTSGPPAGSETSAGLRQVATTRREIVDCCSAIQIRRSKNKLLMSPLGGMVYSVQSVDITGSIPENCKYLEKYSSVISYGHWDQLSLWKWKQ